MSLLNIATALSRKKQGKKAGSLRRTLQVFVSYKLHLLLLFLSMLVTMALGIITPLVIRVIIDVAIAKENTSLLLICCLILVIVPVITGLVTVGQTYISNMMGQNVIRDFRSKLYAHLQKMSLRFFTSTRTGELQSRLSNDVSGAQNVMTNTVTRVIVNTSIVLSTVFAMIYISRLLTLITLVLLPISLWITYKVGNIGRAVQKESQQSLASLTALMQETLSVSGILLTKTFHRQQWVQQCFDEENYKLTELEIRRQMLISWFIMLVNVILAITPAAVYLAAGWQIIFNTHLGGVPITLGAIVAFTALQTRLLPAVGQLLEVQVQVQSALAMFDRIFEYLDLPIDIQESPDALQIPPHEIQGRITFCNVSFTYKRDENVNRLLKKLPQSREQGKLARFRKKTALVPVEAPEVIPVQQQEPSRTTLCDVSCEIKPGQLVALVGPSGAGKTTLTYLIPRLYDVDEGIVKLDGHDVRDLSLATLNEAIGVVTQEIYLFHASVRENLLFAHPDASEEKMIEAAKAAAIHEVIMRLENGYDTIVGERGYRLSGGEKQRVAIARVLLKSPRILILDEATSALDTHSERLIQSTLESLMKQRTTIAIAHRLSTILAADLILVVDNGRIIERGTHAELLNLRGVYTQLYNEQFSRQPLTIESLVS